MSLYENAARERAEHVLEDIVVGEDCITGTIAVPEQRILQLSVPYSSGWKAWVDGEEADLMKSDILYMALPLSAGKHTIILKYSTPCLSIGCIVSALTLLSLCR